MSIKCKDPPSCDMMPKGISKKVTVDVPENEYKLLTKIKEETGKSIKALVTEGVSLVILENAEIIEKHKLDAVVEAEAMEKTLHKLREKRTP